MQISSNLFQALLFALGLPISNSFYSVVCHPEGSLSLCAPDGLKAFSKGIKPSVLRVCWVGYIYENMLIMTGLTSYFIQHP